jgi:hypothetical protein
MKTTLDIRDDLLARAKELAAKQGTSLTKIIEESLALRHFAVIILTTTLRGAGSIRRGFYALKAGIASRCRRWLRSGSFGW